MEKCGNCGRSIGNMETPFLWEDQVVCAECRRILEGKTVAPGGANSRLMLMLLSVVTVAVLVSAGLYGFELHRQSVARKREEQQQHDDLMRSLEEDHVQSQWEIFMQERQTELASKDSALYSWVAEARGYSQDQRARKRGLFDELWGVVDEYLIGLKNAGMTVDQAKAQMAKNGVRDPIPPAP